MNLAARLAILEHKRPPPAAAPVAKSEAKAAAPETRAWSTVRRDYAAALKRDGKASVALKEEYARARRLEFGAD